MLTRPNGMQTTARTLSCHKMWDKYLLWEQARTVWYLSETKYVLAGLVVQYGVETDISLCHDRLNMPRIPPVLWADGRALRYGKRDLPMVIR